MPVTMPLTAGGQIDQVSTWPSACPPDTVISGLIRYDSSLQRMTCSVPRYAGALDSQTVQLVHGAGWVHCNSGMVMTALFDGDDTESFEVQGARCTAVAAPRYWLEGCRPTSYMLEHMLLYCVTGSFMVGYSLTTERIDIWCCYLKTIT
ncbi:hypothetical protein FJT64_005279 [Amphibalanus amphitrite]|uniref:Uncharacterized protein n=1 Tax=Amphibalanus amphitrite TaxID=1232801 RepID=A0A6A4W0U1_AMPAM|nr:hypothetical protein FJT64_005279 [Amphibalanus amphitrite]